jgi:predicted RNase H-like HicB family nuclease
LPELEKDQQDKHVTKVGVVTVPGKPGDDLAPGKEMKKYLIVVEQTQTGYSAYSPDLPGCVSTGRTREEVHRICERAIAFHLDGLREEG